MAKLPKKTTMVETIHRVIGYTMKLFQADKMTMKEYTHIITALNKLKKAVVK